MITHDKIQSVSGHQLIGELHRIARRPGGKPGEILEINAVRHHRDARARHARRGHMAGQHFGDRQDDVCAAPDKSLGCMGQSLQSQAAEADAFLSERRVHFQQQRHAAAPGRPASRDMEEVGALIDNIWAEGPRRACQSRSGDQPIGHLRQLA